MSFNFYVEEEKILLKYSPEQENIAWLSGSKVTVKKVFFFTNKDLVGIDERIPFAVFQFGILDSSKKYFIIDGDKLGIPFSVSFDKTIHLKKEYFIAIRNISIFKRIAHIVKKEIIIGSDESANLQFATFKKLIQQFPNTTEITKYANMRIANIIREELDDTIDSNAEYEKYLNRKAKHIKVSALPEKINECETEKYQYLYEKLENMLKPQNEYVYTENEWQHEILEVLRLVFPKYINVMEKVTIRDVYTSKKKQLDFLLVDYNGNVDVIEIKRPLAGPILTRGQYRNNYVPLRELTGTIMQIEKYIFYLQKWSKPGEEYLTSYCKRKNLPMIDIKIVNPQGIVIFGRDGNLLPKQKQDFEIIKRKYKNIVDIITYDDLLRRLEILINKFSGRKW